MKKEIDKRPSRPTDEDVAPEYELEGKPFVRGKYYQAYRAGYELRISEPDGSTTVRYFTLEEGAVLLEPEVKAYFPDLESVNRDLRSLIDLIPEKRKPRAAAARKTRRKLAL